MGTRQQVIAPEDLGSGQNMSRIRHQKHRPAGPLRIWQLMNVLAQPFRDALFQIFSSLGDHENRGRCCGCSLQDGQQYDKLSSERSLKKSATSRGMRRHDPRSVGPTSRI